MGTPAATASRIQRRFPILVPLRHRDFRFLWAGMTVSLLGDGITTIALAWQAYEISNVPTALALIGDRADRATRRSSCSSAAR